MTLFDQGTDHIQHAADLFGSLGMCSSRLYIHGSHVFPALCNITLGDHRCFHTFLDCLLDDLIIHIGKVGYIINLVTLMLHIASYCIKYDHGPCISNMDQIIYCRSADIHLHLSFGKRYKLFLPFCQGIVNLHFRLRPSFYSAF